MTAQLAAAGDAIPLLAEWTSVLKPDLGVTPRTRRRRKGRGKRQHVQSLTLAEWEPRIDYALVSDLITRTILPSEELLVGYAVLEKIDYRVCERFGTASKSIVSEVLMELAQAGIVVEKPFRDCWRLVRQ